MKKISRTLVVLIILLLSTTGAYATVEVNYDLVCIANDGDSETVLITKPYDAEIWNYYDRGLICDWGDDYHTTQEMTIKATKDTDIGNHAVLVNDLADTTDDGFDIINVLVYDNYQTDIYSAKAGKKKATIKWNKGYSNYYELQYKKAGGVWNTAMWDSKTSFTVKGLTKGKKYSFRVRPVTPSYEWGDQYGPWSDVVTLKIK